MTSALTNYDRHPDQTTPLIEKPPAHGQAGNRPCANRGFDPRLSLSTQLRKTTCLFLCLVTAFSIAGVLFLPGHDPLASCLAYADIPHAVKGSKDWHERTRSWNDRVTYIPAAVAVPQSIDQIKAAVSCGIRNQVRVTAQAGGHSFGSYGLGGEDGHLVLALDQMYGVTLYDNHTAKFQPGARLGHVSVELYNQGRRAIPHGACTG